MTNNAWVIPKGFGDWLVGELMDGVPPPLFRGTRTAAR